MRRTRREEMPGQPSLPPLSYLRGNLVRTSRPGRELTTESNVSTPDPAPPGAGVKVVRPRIRCGRSTCDPVALMARVCAYEDEAQISNAKPEIHLTRPRPSLMGSGLVKTLLSSLLFARDASSCLRPGAPDRSRGQRGAPHWTNDVDVGEDRRTLELEEARTQEAELISHALIRIRPMSGFA
jgi:hypothetical protein